MCPCLFKALLFVFIIFTLFLSLARSLLSLCIQRRREPILLKALCIVYVHQRDNYSTHYSALFNLSLCLRVCAGKTGRLYGTLYKKLSCCILPGFSFYIDFFLFFFILLSFLPFSLFSFWKKKYGGRGGGFLVLFPFKPVCTFWGRKIKIQGVRKILAGSRIGN